MGVSRDITPVINSWRLIRIYSNRLHAFHQNFFSCFPMNSFQSMANQRKYIGKQDQSRQNPNKTQVQILWHVMSYVHRLRMSYCGDTVT